MRRALCSLGLLGLLLLAFPPLASGDEQGERGVVAVAEASRLAGDEQRTRFVVDLDAHLDFRVFVLADPYRVVIDLPQTDFQLDEDAGKSGRGLVSAYRYGRFAPGKSRIVLDATGPVEIDRSFALEAEDDQPARLVIDLVESDRESVLAAISDDPPRRTGDSSDAPNITEHTAVPPGAGEEADRIVVVIDPGHGGIDPGAVSPSGVTEKEIVLEFARRLQDELEKLDRFDVRLTREADVFIPLADRVAYAREQRASLFISVHADSVSSGSVSGASVYTLSERASDDVAAALAEQENRSDALAGIHLTEDTDDVADILIDLMRRETKGHSVFFARTLVSSLEPDIELVRNPLRSAGFHVLRAHDVPSVLLELGFLTNRDDEQALTDEDWQARVAARVAEAVQSYFGQRHARGPF